MGHQILLSKRIREQEILFSFLLGVARTVLTGFRVSSTVARTAGCGIHMKGSNSYVSKLLINKVWDGFCEIDLGGGAGFVTDVAFQDGGSGGQADCGILIGGVASGTVSSISFQNITISMGGSNGFTNAAICLADGVDGLQFTNVQAVQNGFDSIGWHAYTSNGGSAPEWVRCTNCSFEGGHNSLPGKDGYSLRLVANVPLQIPTQLVAVGV